MPVLPFPLCALSDEIMGCLELGRDLLFHKIPEADIPYYVHASLRAGRLAAAPYRGKNIREMCREAGLRYAVTHASGTFHGVAFRAQIDFAANPPEIIVYADSLEGMRRVSREVLAEPRETSRPSNPEADLKLLIDIHLAHEFFHFLEYRDGAFTNERLERIEVFRLGPYTKKASVAQCSEIAAHAFCKTLLNLPCLPNLLDYVYLIKEGLMTGEQFQRRIEACKCWMSRPLHPSPGVI